MEEDIFIENDKKHSSVIFPNCKKPIKYLNLDEISTLNFGEHFNSQFFEKANRGGLVLNYINEDISFDIFALNSIVNMNLDLKYFKIGF
jgi:hypothetical protein